MKLGVLAWSPNRIKKTVKINILSFFSPQGGVEKIHAEGGSVLLENENYGREIAIAKAFRRRKGREGEMLSDEVFDDRDSVSSQITPAATRELNFVSVHVKKSGNSD